MIILKLNNKINTIAEIALATLTGSALSIGVRPLLFIMNITALSIPLLNYLEKF